jgi:hypothetical protein
MVRTCTGNFAPNTPKALDAHTRAASTRPRGPTHEHRATASHIERAHAGADGEPHALWCALATPPAGDGVLLHRLLSDAPSHVRRGG